MNTSDEEPPGAAPQPTPRADEIGNRLLDDSTDVPVPPDLDSDERRRIADLQWIDSMLEQSHGTHREQVERALAKAFKRLGAAPEPKIVRLHPTGKRWFSRLAAVAILVAICGVWWNMRPNTALALVEQAHRAALVESDRTYRVTFGPTGGAVRPVEGVLQVRGGRRFLYSHSGSGPLGARFLIGGNDGEYWFVPPIGPAVIHDQEGTLAKWLSQAEAEMPFLQIASLFERLRKDYELKSGPAQPLQPDGPPMDRLSGRLRRPAGASAAIIPKSIEAWIDRPTGVVHKIVLEFPSPGSSGDSSQMTLTLTSEAPLPTDHYQLNDHAGNRRVIDLRANN